MLGTFVVLYLFLGGAGAGALFVAAVWSLLFHRTVTRTFEQSRAFRALAGRLYLVGFGLLALSVFCLLIDLGSPHRFFLLFLRPTASLLSVGSFVLLATLLASGLLAAQGAGSDLRGAGGGAHGVHRPVPGVDGGGAPLE